MNKKNVFLWIVWILEGMIVGIGAILPGVSGGTLCYAFGMYNPLLEVLSNPFKNLKKYWFMLAFFVIGAGIGFVAFAGVTNWLLNTFESAVLCAFVGLIIGTVPDLWKEAGEQGRTKGSIAAMVISFLAISAVFYIFKNVWQLTIAPTFIGYLICGIVWGLSFIVPGFSSSTLLLFFGIYEPMSEGISKLDFSVIVPIGIAMVICFLLLSKVMKLIFDKYHNIASHSILGFVIATTIMVIPFDKFLDSWLVNSVCIIGGIIAALGFTALCGFLKKKAE